MPIEERQYLYKQKPLLDEVLHRVMDKYNEKEEFERTIDILKKMRDEDHYHDLSDDQILKITKQVLAERQEYQKKIDKHLDKYASKWKKPFHILNFIFWFVVAYFVIAFFLVSRGY